jgi:hypothetical protein
VKKSGLADSPFFQTPPRPKAEPASATTPVSAKPMARTATAKAQARPSKPHTMPPSNRDTTQPRNHDTTVSRYHDAVIEVIRRAVKELGKEAATHRFTVAEKKAIAEIVFTYKSQGVRTSENEVARIAINFIIQDYKENGAASVLDRALRALYE